MIKKVNNGSLFCAWAINQEKNKSKRGGKSYLVTNFNSLMRTSLRNIRAVTHIIPSDKSLEYQNIINNQ